MKNRILQFRQSYLPYSFVFTAIFFLGFTSGLPLLLVGSTLQAWFTKTNMSLLLISSLSFVGIPYLFKFLWAPLFDLISLPFLGKRCSWLLICQIFLIFLFSSFRYLTPESDTLFIVCIALCIAFISASQDIVINALQTEIVAKSDLGLSAAAYISGYRIAMIISGGFALILAEYIGFQNMYALMSLFFIPGLIATFSIYEPHQAALATTNKQLKFTNFIRPFRDFFLKPSAIWILLFLLTFKMSYSLSLLMTPTFLLRSLEFSLLDVGLLNKTLGIIMAIAGVWVCGYCTRRYSLRNILLVSGSMEAISNLIYCFLALTGKNYMGIIIAISSETFSAGIESAAFLTYIMRLCNVNYTATQFALLSGISSFSRIVLGPIAGWLIQKTGWSGFYFSLFCSFIPIALWIYTSRTLFREVEPHTKTHTQSQI